MGYKINSIINILRYENIIKNIFYLKRNCHKSILDLKRLHIFYGSKLRLEKSSKIDFNGKLYIGYNSPKIPKSAKSNLFMGNGAKLISHGTFRICNGFFINIHNNAELELGSGYFNHGVKIYCHNKIRIGYNVAIAEDVILMDFDEHKIDELSLSKSIQIGNNVWIGIRAIILKGVNIGEGSVIAAGALVARDVPPRCLAAGVPAKIIKENINWIF